MSDTPNPPRLTNLDDDDLEITRDIRRPSIPRMPQNPEAQERPNGDRNS